MKNVFAIFLLFIIGCKGTDKTISMPGAYKMLSQSAKSDKTDTTYTSREQLKIFTEDYMMYANVNPSDSSSSFGIGTYTSTGDSLTENVIYTSSDSTSNDTLRNFTLLIEKTSKGFKQVIPEMNFNGQVWKWTEEYESVGSSAKTSLDGPWKMVKRFAIKGKDTTFYNNVQYKTYFGGFVIWGHTWSDSLNKIQTGIGYGKFEMTGNKVKESMTSSTYSSVRGHDFDIDITLNGKDEFTQSMIDPDGTKTSETYMRLKK
jgi:hypothetical protein